MTRDFLDKFSINSSDTIKNALRKIDDNKKGFLIVLNDDEDVVGTLTDGDIRRAFIKGKLIEDGLKGVYTTNFKSLKPDDGMFGAAELFKNSAIKFIPIIENNKLLNVITKRQNYALLLQDIDADLRYDFFSLNEDIIDYEIYLRPWGFYKTTILNDYFQSKIISVKPGGKLSLQSHNHREEYWIIVHGKGTVQLEQSFLDVKCGSSVYIPKGTKHRLINIDKTESLILTEVQIGDYLGEDDIIRYEDVYGRI